MGRINIAISNYITQKGIRERFVAQKAGIPVDVFIRICRGHRKISAEEFFSICNALEVDPKIFWVGNTDFTNNDIKPA